MLNEIHIRPAKVGDQFRATIRNNDITLFVHNDLEGIIKEVRDSEAYGESTIITHNILGGIDKIIKPPNTD